MESILDSYKKIVHKAVDLGLISEENKLIYLSSIDQSASNHDGSDLEEQSPRPSALRNTFKLSVINDLRAVPNKLPAATDYFSAHAACMNAIIDESTASSSHGTYSLEDYSLLDELKSPASDSDLEYYSKSRRVHLKKPIRRNKEIVDFHIPIYLGIGQKRRKSRKRVDLGFSSAEDLTHFDKRNARRARDNWSRKPCIGTKKVATSFGAVESTKLPRNASKMMARDVSYDDDYSTESPQQAGPSTERARGDGLKEQQNEHTLEQKSNEHPYIEDLAPSTDTKCNEEVPISDGRVRVNDRFEVSVGGGDGSEYCKMKEVLVVNPPGEDAKSNQQEKLLQVNIFCQLVPNSGASNDPKEEIPNADDGDAKKSEPKPKASKTGKRKEPTKEKTCRKPTLQVLSKMFSKISLPSRFRK